jgi:hypothetical protein
MLTRKNKDVGDVSALRSNHVEFRLPDRSNAFGFLAVDQAEAATQFIDFLPTLLYDFTAAASGSGNQPNRCNGFPVLAFVLGRCERAPKRTIFCRRQDNPTLVVSEALEAGQSNGHALFNIAHIVWCRSPRLRARRFLA